MISAEELISFVGEKMVQDSRFESSELLSFLNDGINVLVPMVNPPDLLVVNSQVIVEADKNEITGMLTDYNERRVKSIFNVKTKRPVKDYYRIDEFLKIFPYSSSGDIVGMLFRGKNIYCAYVPTSSTELSITYSKKPTLFKDEYDNGKLITYLPDSLGEMAIKHYAASRCFDIIEDGVEGKKVNHDHHYQKFMEYVSMISEYFGIENIDGKPEFASSSFGSDATQCSLLDGI